MSFKLKERQRQALLTCWKRPRDREIAAVFLLDVEVIVSDWLQQLERHPSTGIKEQIAHAEDLHKKSISVRDALKDLPGDVAGLLNVIWVRSKYGMEYFRLHSEAYRKDRERNSPRKLMLTSVVRGLAPDGTPDAPPEVSEASKLPPDFIKQAEDVLDFLDVLATASAVMGDMLKGAKQWHNKEPEKRLLYALALSYELHFGKRPSAANGTLFRKLVSDLSDILGYELGADITREVVAALARIR